MNDLKKFEFRWHSWRETPENGQECFCDTNKGLMTLSFYNGEFYDFEYNTFDVIRWIPSEDVAAELDRRWMDEQEVDG